MKCIKDIEMKTESRKRKRTGEESDDEKQEKRSRFDNISEKHNDDLKTKSSIAFLGAEGPTLDEIEDKEPVQTEPETPDNSFAENESKAKKENAIFMNMPTESEVCTLLFTDKEKNISGTEKTNIDQSLYSQDDLNGKVVGGYKAIRSSPTTSETENDDQSECTGKQGKTKAFGNESDTEKGGDLIFHKIDSAQERKTTFDNCTEHEIEQNLKEKNYKNNWHISHDKMGQKEVQIEQINAPDVNSIENEYTSSVCTLENQIVTIDESVDRDNNENEEMFLYRMLKPGESYHHGIKPDDVLSNTSIEDHVAYGSCDEVKSKYISCAKTISGIKKFAYLIKVGWRPQSRSIVKIDKTKLSDDCKIFDLTEQSIRSKYLRSDRAKKFALRFEEVLLAPSCAIPVKCITEVATVQNGTIHWIE